MGFEPTWSSTTGEPLGYTGTRSDFIHVDLFAGIGGFARAFDLLGTTPKAALFSEIDPHACEVYRRHYPAAVPLGDVHGIRGEDLRARHPGARWFVTGGFPCQDLADPGNGKGLDGDRSRLWFEYQRIISELRPDVVVVENVASFLRLRKHFERFLESLREIDYACEWDCVTAENVGAPHHRDRIWIIAYPKARKAPTSRWAAVRPDQDPWADWADVAETGRFRGRPTVVPVKQVAEKAEWYRRLHCLGNAVVPQAAAVALKRAMDLLGLSKSEVRIAS